MSILCSNCGKENHMAKKCGLPIQSFGIILCHIGKDKIQYVNIRRRNTYGYFDFLRGNYNLMDSDYIKQMIDTMTLQEKRNILNKNFIDLWKELWHLKTNKIKNKNKSIFYKSMIKFNILRNGIFNDDFGYFYNTKSLVSKSKTKYDTPEWNFPKGKRNYGENNTECAVREFEEETNIFDRSKYELIPDKTFACTHKGSDNVYYKTTYYVAVAKKLINFNLERNTFQKQEISTIEWMTYDENIKVFRPYEQYKINILNKLHSFMKLRI